MHGARKLGRRRRRVVKLESDLDLARRRKDDAVAGQSKLSNFSAAILPRNNTNSSEPQRVFTFQEQYGDR
jgi:hypothetical protein